MIAILDFPNIGIAKNKLITIAITIHKVERHEEKKQRTNTNLGKFNDLISQKVFGILCATILFSPTIRNHANFSYL